MRTFIRTQWPIVTVYVAIVGSLALTVWVDFRAGAIGFALCVLVALGLRFALSDTQAGLLKVRRRRVDLVVLTTLGVTLLILAVIVPGPHS